MLLLYILLVIATLNLNFIKSNVIKEKNLGKIQCTLTNALLHSELNPLQLNPLIFGEVL